MKKILMVAAVLVAVLAFLALPESQAGAGRPVRWKATISGDNIIGSVDFVGGVDHVNINNGLATTCAGASYLELQLFEPSFQFQNMGDFSNSYDSDLASYGFPNMTRGWPYCVADFLNGNIHPNAEYPHIILRFSTCGCEYPPNSNTDLMKMGVGESEALPVRMSFFFFAYNWLIRPTLPSTPFLNLMMKAHGWNSTGSGLRGDFDVKIVRTSATEWTAYVNTVFDNPKYQDELQLPDPNSYSFAESDNILGEYATYEPSTNKKGKTIWTPTYHYPRAKAPLKFQIKFWQY